MMAKPRLIAKAFSNHAGCAALAKKNQQAPSFYWSFLYESKWQQVFDKVVSVALWVERSSVT
jgi:hypothetical protein